LVGAQAISRVDLPREKLARINSAGSGWEKEARFILALYEVQKSLTLFRRLDGNLPQKRRFRVEIGHFTHFWSKTHIVAHSIC
jgi:hypothetical protein